MLPISARRVCTLKAPPIELRPNRKPCGPRRISARSRSYNVVTADPLRPSNKSFLKNAADGSSPTPKSWVRMPRTLIPSIKLSWLLPLTPGVKLTRSLTSVRLTLLMNSPERAVIASGTSCTDSARLVAVTMTSSRTCDMAGVLRVEATIAAETAPASAFLRIRCRGIPSCVSEVVVMVSPQLSVFSLVNCFLATALPVPAFLISGRFYHSGYKLAKASDD